jgi:transcriptional regulator with XRE-family HTH domain
MDTPQQNIIRRVIGRNLRTMRNLRQLPQKTVGAFLGVTFQQLQKYEKGTNSIAAEKLLLLSVVLQCPVQDLFKDALEVTGGIVPNSDAYKVEQLIADFTRISSHEMRDQVCNMVKTVASLAAVGEK